MQLLQYRVLEHESIAFELLILMEHVRDYNFEDAIIP